MTDPIEMPFGKLSRVDPRNHVFRWGLRSAIVKEGILRGGAWNAPTCPMTLCRTAVQKRPN